MTLEDEGDVAEPIHQAPKQNSHDEVVGRFLQYAPTPVALEISAELRAAYADLASLIWRTVPSGDIRCKSLALTHLEESMMFANKGTFRTLQDPNSPIL